MSSVSLLSVHVLLFSSLPFSSVQLLFYSLFNLYCCCAGMCMVCLYGMSAKVLYGMLWIRCCAVETAAYRQFVLMDNCAAVS